MKEHKINGGGGNTKDSYQTNGEVVKIMHVSRSKIQKTGT